MLLVLHTVGRLSIKLISCVPLRFLMLNLDDLIMDDLIVTIGICGNQNRAIRTKKTKIAQSQYLKEQKCN